MYKTQFTLQISSLLIASLLLSGCLSQTSVKPKADQQNVSLMTAYDYQLVNSSLQNLSLKQLIVQLESADIVFVGEFHGNHASHLLEMQLLAGLYQQNPNILLSMEMFNRDQQTMLNQYLDSEIGEVQLVKETPAWNNYVASYRPLVEFAKQHFLPVVAANASADIVRCIGRKGESYLSKLNPQEKANIAQNPFAEIPGYKAKFNDFLEEMRHLPDERKNNSYLAQITRDNTMAESIYQAWLNHPQHQVIHINGAFHSENHLGTVAALKQLDPKLNIQVITPIRVESFDEIKGFKKSEKNANDDFIYFLKPQPEQYLDAVYKRKDRQAMFNKSEQASCK